MSDPEALDDPGAVPSGGPGDDAADGGSTGATALDDEGPGDEDLAGPGDDAAAGGTPASADD